MDIRLRLTKGWLLLQACGLAVLIIGSRHVAAQPSTITGIIAYFNGTACPSGWTEFTDARGFYIVGRVSGGTLDTSVGTALTNQEDRTHTHSVPALSLPGGSGQTTGTESSGHVHGGITAGPDVSGGESATHTHTVTANNGGSTGTGTTGTANGLAPYIQLLACKKS